MSLTPNEMELHRQLIAAFNDYIIYNLKWEASGRSSTATKLRKKLRLIIDLAYLRSKEVQYARKGEEQDLIIGKEFFRELVRKHGTSERSFEKTKLQREQRKQAASKRNYDAQTKALAQYREKIKKAESVNNEQTPTNDSLNDNKSISENNPPPTT